jgi:hypothetical protein
MGRSPVCLCLIESVHSVPSETLAGGTERSACRVLPGVAEWDECIAECEPLWLTHRLGTDRAQSLGVLPMQLLCRSGVPLQAVRVPTRARELSMRVVTSFGDDEAAAGEQEPPSSVVYRSMYWCNVAMGDIPAAVEWLEGLTDILA